MYQIGNIYGITAIAVIGGGLFGFDISSMSAMYVQPTYYAEDQPLTKTACPLNSTDATSTRVWKVLLPAADLGPMYRAASQQPVSLEHSHSCCFTANISQCLAAHF